MIAAPRHLSRRLLPAVVAFALVSLLVLRTSSAAFTADTDNEANSFATGQIELADDAVGALFEVTGLVPGDTHTRCITVTYTGSLDAAQLDQVRLYAAGPVSDPGALSDALRITIEDGTGATDADCTGFALDGTLLATTALTSFTALTDHASGVGAWTPATSGASRSYRITVALPADAGNAAQNLTLSGLTFVWELRSA